MTINLIKKNFNILINIIKGKFTIFAPQKSDVLIWGTPSFINIFNHREYNLNKKKINYLHVWGENINLAVLLRCLCKFKFTFTDYTKYYIMYVKPDVIISFLDNYKTIYQIKKKDYKIFLIQHSWRSGESNFFKNNQRPKVGSIDYFFVQNKNIVKKYKSICKAKFSIIGSFLSNNVPKKKVKKKYDIVFISTFRYVNNFKINGNITFEDYLKAESDLVKKISLYCLKKNKRLYILPTRKEHQKQELSFFKECLKDNKNWKMIKRISSNYDFPYTVVDKADIVVGIDSTLLYEAFGRGVKTIFFDVRPKNKFLSNNRHFAWPKKLMLSGPFWEGNDDYESIFRTINRVEEFSPSKWNKIVKNYKNDLMPYDKNNKSFKKILNKHLKSE